MTQDKQLSIIIVNYNSGQYVLDCIASLKRQVAVNFEVIVIDNASPDNSLVLLREGLTHDILLIESSENLGFGRANNLGVSKARGEFLLLLNPDTIISDANTLKVMLDVFNTSPRLGLLGPAIEEPRKSKQVLPRYTYPLSKNLRYTDKLKGLPGSIAWLLGACLLIKHSTFNEINGFDADYFLYGEDADICLRVRLAGYEIGYCESVKITHVAGVSEFGADTLDKWLRKKRGVFLFCIKHFDKRDVLKLARNAIFKSKVYLMMLSFMGLFRCQKKRMSEDKKHRLQATVIAANEVIDLL